MLITRDMFSPKDFSDLVTMVFLLPSALSRLTT